MPPKAFCLFSFSQFGGEASPRVEPRDARAACAQSFRERALRNKFKLELARQYLAFELFILANIRRHHFFYLARCEQNAHAETINAGVIAHNS